MRPLSRHLLLRAADQRSGMVRAVHDVPAAASDLPGLVNATVLPDVANPWQGVAGGVALHDMVQARMAAVAEGLERYCAGITARQLKRRADLGAESLIDEDQWSLFSAAQRAQPGFPWPTRQSPDDAFVQVHHLATNEPAWVPQELLGLGIAEGSMRLPSTSSGLAAHLDSQHGPWLAVLRALQEVLERDALSVTWLHSLGGAELQLSPDLAEVAERVGARVHAFDLTQCWNPQPVVAVAGRLDVEGRPRHGFGIACRATVDEALRKAWLEWGQSLRYADHLCRQARIAIPEAPDALREFSQHAAYYTAHPAGWDRLPLLARRRPAGQHPVESDGRAPALVQLQQTVRALQFAGIDTYYRELTTADVAQAGLRVVRVLAPQLTPLHADERAPFLGGRCTDVAWRYPHAQLHGPFPNPWPHPLG